MVASKSFRLRPHRIDPRARRLMQAVARTKYVPRTDHTTGSESVQATVSAACKTLSSHSPSRP
ncbi:MAG: hypothetical protein ACK56I_16800, partial [bacterium]